MGAEPQGTPTLGTDHLLVREGADGALDPGDEYGLERALQLVERDGGEVTIVSMGPEIAVAAVQRGLAMGAARAVLITDPALRGSDTLVTARCSPRRSAASDRSTWSWRPSSRPTATRARCRSRRRAPGTAERHVRNFVRCDRRIRAPGGAPDGLRLGGLACPLPALVTSTTGVAAPRYPSLKGVMAAKSKPVDRPSLTELGLVADEIRSTQSVTGVGTAPEKAGGRVIEAGPDAAAEIADLLEEARVI